MYSQISLTCTLIKKPVFDKETGELVAIGESLRSYTDANGAIETLKAIVVIHYRGKAIETMIDPWDEKTRLAIRGRAMSNENGEPIILQSSKGEPSCVWHIQATSIINLDETDQQFIVIVGNLGRDPELRYTPTGKEVATISVAVNHQYNDASGQKIKETAWWRVTVWGSQAVNIQKYAHKGSRILFEGYLTTDPETNGPRMWESRDGDIRASFEMQAVTFKLLDAKTESAAPVYQGDRSLRSDIDEEIPF
jgi:single-strand DNA-binding protein